MIMFMLQSSCDCIRVTLILWSCDDPLMITLQSYYPPAVILLSSYDWSYHNQLMINLLSSYNQLTVILWSTYYHLTINLLSSYDQLMINLWLSYDHLLINLQSTYDRLIIIFFVCVYIYFCPSEERVKWTAESKIRLGSND